MQFIKLNNYESLFDFSCPNDLLFDVNQKKCNYPNLVSCQSITTTTFPTTQTLNGNQKI
jgi:hypothetical protein